MAGWRRAGRAHAHALGDQSVPCTHGQRRGGEIGLPRARPRRRPRFGIAETSAARRALGAHRTGETPAPDGGSPATELSLLGPEPARSGMSSIFDSTAVARRGLPIIPGGEVEARHAAQAEAAELLGLETIATGRGALRDRPTQPAPLCSQDCGVRPRRQASTRVASAELSLSPRVRCGNPSAPGPGRRSRAPRKARAPAASLAPDLHRERAGRRGYASYQQRHAGSG